MSGTTVPYPNCTKSIKKLTNFCHSVVTTKKRGLHIGHSYMIHSFLVKGEDPTFCILCNELLSWEHMLLLCSDLIAIREREKKIMQSLRLLFRGVSLDSIFDFLKEINVFKKVVVDWVLIAFIHLYFYTVGLLKFSCFILRWSVWYWHHVFCSDMIYKVHWVLKSNYLLWTFVPLYFHGFFKLFYFLFSIRSWSWWSTQEMELKMFTWVRFYLSSCPVLLCLTPSCLYLPVLYSHLNVCSENIFEGCGTKHSNLQKYMSDNSLLSNMYLSFWCCQHLQFRNNEYFLKLWKCVCVIILWQLHWN